MKISKETMEVFKNFSQINQGLVVDEEKCLKTMSLTGSIIAVYDTEETFPLFSIWDFAKFNALIDAMGVENSDFEFSENDGEFGAVTVTSGSRKIKYEYADSGAMPIFQQIKPSEKYKDFDKFDFTFDLSAEDIKEIKRINSIFGFSQDVLKIEMKDDVGTLTIFSETNETTSNYSMEIDGKGSGSCCLKVNDLIMIPGDYMASVSEQMVKFQNRNKQLLYFVRTHLINR